MAFGGGNDAKVCKVIILAGRPIAERTRTNVESITHSTDIPRLI